MEQTAAAGPETSEALVYDVAQRKQAQQRDSIAAIDAKVATLAIFASGLLAALGVIFPLASPHEMHVHAVVLGILFALVLVTYGRTLYLLYHAFRVRRQWDWRPHLTDVISHCGNYAIADLQVWAACEYRDAIERNRAQIEDKVSRVNESLLWIGAQSVLTAITGFVVFIWR